MKKQPFFYRAAAVATIAVFFTCAHSGESETIKAKIKEAQDGECYFTQMLGTLDQPVGSELKLPGLIIPTAVDEKGALRLTLGENNVRTISGKSGTAHFSLKNEQGRSFRVGLLFQKTEERGWTVRNLTTLHITPGKDETDTFVIVDANANGVYNEVGVDGVVWKGYIGVFPLPGAGEVWCTPNLEIHELKMGPWGEECEIRGRAISTLTAGGRRVLAGVNQERMKLGLPTRPEDPELSKAAQAHTHYMALNDTLTHPEDPNKPGYSKEGHESGMRSILAMGHPPELAAFGHICTLYHRIDVIHANTRAFGVAAENSKTGRPYSTIDGRTNRGPDNPAWYPILCPRPEQENVPTHFNLESPDPIKGDREAGFPITASFATQNLQLLSHSLRLVEDLSRSKDAKTAKKGKKGDEEGNESIECYTFQAGADTFMSMGRMVALIAKDPLRPHAVYEVSMKVSVDGKEWARTWRFTTQAPMLRPPLPPRPRPEESDSKGKGKRR